MIALKYALAIVVAAIAFLYYLFFGDKELTPSIHRNLSGQRLAKLLAEAFSYGADGAEFVVCVPDGTLGAVLRKEVRAKDDVHLVLQGADPTDYGEDTARAAAEVAERFAMELATPLEAGCYFYATGVSIYPRVGWSGRAAV